MRTREIIESFIEEYIEDRGCTTDRVQRATLEVLLDIRDLLAKDNIRSDYIEDRDNRYTKP